MTTIHTTNTTTFINASRNSSGSRNGSGSTTAVTTGEGTRGASRLESQVRFFSFFLHYINVVITKVDEESKKGPRDATNISWATDMKTTGPETRLGLLA